MFKIVWGKLPSKKRTEKDIRELQERQTELREELASRTIGDLRRKEINAELNGISIKAARLGGKTGNAELIAEGYTR